MSPGEVRPPPGPAIDQGADQGPPLRQKTIGEALKRNGQIIEDLAGGENLRAVDYFAAGGGGAGGAVGGGTPLAGAPGIGSGRTM